MWDRLIRVWDPTIRAERKSISDQIPKDPKGNSRGSRRRPLTCDGLTVRRWIRFVLPQRPLLAVQTDPPLSNGSPLEQIIRDQGILTHFPMLISSRKVAGYLVESQIQFMRSSHDTRCHDYCCGMHFQPAHVVEGIVTQLNCIRVIQICRSCIRLTLPAALPTFHCENSAA